jgi:hypothetical protein
MSRSDRDADKQDLAADVLTMAYVGGMPDSYWHTDPRIKRACEVLGIETGESARAFAAAVIER